MSEYRSEKIFGWGMWPRGVSALDRPEWTADIDLQALLQDHPTVLARGKGASYGDQAMNTGSLVLLTTQLNRLLEWDQEQGLLHAEAGLTLNEVLRFSVPRGFFLPVTPGTSYVTLGGALAFDVHGKSQHQDGNFGNQVAGFTLLLASGDKVWVTPEEEPELFAATVAGMGMTGIILDMRIKLVPIETSKVMVQYRPFQSLEEARDIFLAGDKEYPFTVAWMDQGCERGVVTLGRFARRQEVERGEYLAAHYTAAIRVPFQAPRIGSWLALNRLSMSLFYKLYYKMKAGKGTQLEDYKNFFYPLDGIKDWNRVYGPKGFLQYQLVVPLEGGIETIRKVTGLLRSRSIRPCLAVLKIFGDMRAGTLSFPREGFTLAMDIPVSPKLLTVLDEADRLVLEGGGRLYLAKDSRMKPAMARAMYPELDEWLEVRKKVDPEGRFSSDLVRRLEIS